MENFKVDFIGIGGAKCASTWVYKCLLEHPEVCGPYIKETNFFVTKRHPLAEKSREHQEVLYHDGIESYRKYFDTCKEDSVKGEISVSYMADEGTPELIKKHFPDVKILAFVRDPVKRAFSHFWFVKKFTMREKSKTFEEALNNNPAVYIDWGMYYKNLKRYYDVFPGKNIKVFFVDDLKKDPVKFMASVYEFLEVDDKFVAPSAKKRENAAREVRYKWFRKFVDWCVDKMYKFVKVTRMYFIVDFLRLIGFQRLIHYVFYKINTKPFSKPEIKRETADELRKVFLEDIEKLEKLTNRDLSHWK